MLRYTFLPLLILLSGCSYIGFLTGVTAQYDAGEYLKATHLVATLVLDQSCTPTTISDINSQVTELQLYSAGTPGNKLLVIAENQLLKASQELAQHSQPVSPVYCSDKLSLLRREALSIQHLIGAKTHG